MMLKNCLQKLSRQRRKQRVYGQIEALLPELYRLAYALCGGRDGAEELAHDACANAMASYADADLPDEAACHAWLRTILVNRFRDRYRREKRSPLRAAYGHDGDNIVEFAESTDPSPEDWARYADLAEATQAAIAALPPEVRIVTTLYMIDEKSYKEIAAIADCPLGTVMSRLSRGRRLLRDMLAPFSSSADAPTAARR